MRNIESMMAIMCSAILLAAVPAGAQEEPAAPILPLWRYNAISTRDGSRYPGAIVGRNPVTNSGTTRVPVFLVPLIFKTHTLGVSFDSTSGLIGTQPGDATFDPTAPDACYPAPNNIPINLVAESPLFDRAPFEFGGTFVGDTQYIDAFQRANFWQVLGDRRDHYHVLLSPVRVLDPIVVDVPAIYGVGVTNSLLFGPPAMCVPFGIIDGNWFGNYLDGTIIPSLTAKGVNSGNLPVFVATVAGWSSSVTNRYSPGFSGLHGATGFPWPIQSFALASFRRTLDPSGRDTEPLSHELAEWLNDPYGSNPTPMWGHTGQVAGCQGNLEVGDPLSFTAFTVPMPNGFTYTVQELAFFSWFFGGPSIGVNNWFSNNGTFLTDAGRPCEE